MISNISYQLRPDITTPSPKQLRPGTFGAVLLNEFLFLILTDPELPYDHVLSSVRHSSCAALLIRVHPRSSAVSFFWATWPCSCPAPWPRSPRSPSAALRRNAQSAWRT